MTETERFGIDRGQQIDTLWGLRSAGLFVNSQNPLGLTAIIQAPVEGLSEVNSVPLGTEDKPKSDAGASRGMIKFRGVYPLIIEPHAHLRHRGGEIGPDTAHLDDVGHGCAVSSAGYIRTLHDLCSLYEGSVFDLDQRPRGLVRQNSASATS